MSKKLYDSSGFFDLGYCKKASCPFNVIVGGRGTGKTFGVLSDFIEDKSDSFMYMRRTEAEIATIANERFNPFKAINYEKNINISSSYSKTYSVGEFYRNFDESKEFIGYASALSTFGKIRGASLEDVGRMVVDEFNRTKGSRYLDGEADLFFNAYETISRNREIKHPDKPLIAYLLSNSTTLDSPILEEMGIVSVIENMKRNGDLIYTNKSRGIHIEMLDDSPISEKKKDTALYRLTQGTSYYNHAINNDFAYDSMDFIRKVKLIEYLPFVRINNVYVYRHKNRLEYFVSMSKANCELNFDDSQIKLFRRNIGMTLYKYSLAGYVYFESFRVKNMFYHFF